MNQLKIGFLIGLVSLSIAALIVSLELMNVKQALQAKEVQIEHLIREIGDLKGAEVRFPLQKVSVKRAKNIVRANEANVKPLAILLVGSHKGLTDTIMLAFVSPASQKISLVSIPRDLYLHGRRINSYHHLFGMESLKSMVEEVTGVTIDRSVHVNMVGFEKLVDSLNGIIVEVQKDLYDPFFPDSKEPYYIAKGAHTLNGEEALKYVRSRQTTNDFDRARRQQQVISAIKAKMLEKNFLEKAKEFISLYEMLQTYVETDISVFEAIDYLKKYQSYVVSSGNIISNQNFLYSQINENGAYMLLPKKSDFSEIQGYVKSLL